MNCKTTVGLKDAIVVSETNHCLAFMSARNINN